MTATHVKRTARLVRIFQFQEIGIALLLILVFVTAGLIRPRFFALATIRSILLWVPLLAIIAMGQMMVIITRGIDVSVGAIVGVAGMIAGMLLRDVSWFNIFFAIVTSLLVGLLLGALNGSLVAWANIPPVIVTLGGLSAYRGLSFLLSGGRQVDGYQLPIVLIRLSQKGPFGIWVAPWVVFIVLAIAVLTHLFLNHTTMGRDIYAIGNNPEAAQLRGIPVKRVLFIVYTFTGAMSGFAGLLYASRFGFLNPGQTGAGLELQVIAAVVIGGVTVSGGVGSVLGVILGCLLLGTINVALSMLGVASTWQQAVYGSVILFAITLDLLMQRRLQQIQEQSA
jgi:rhamnose transport system permease protein